MEEEFWGPIVEMAGNCALGFVGVVIWVVLVVGLVWVWERLWEGSDE